MPSLYESIAAFWLTVGAFALAYLAVLVEGRS